MKKLLLALLVTAPLAAYPAKQFVPAPENVMTHKGVVTVNIPWVKDKGGKFDVKMMVHNDNDDKGMIIFLSDMGCKRGAVTGELRHTFFNTGEKTIDFRPGQMKSFNLVCKIEGKPTGDFQLSIRKVYDNPSLDGKTINKVIAKDLTWTQSDRSE